MNRIFVCLLLVFFASGHFFNEEQREHFFDAITETRDSYEELQRVTQHVLAKSAKFMKERIVEDLDELNGVKDCMTCRAAFSTLDTVLRKEVVINALESFAVLICNQVESTNTTVCPGAVKMMGDIIVPVLADFLLSPDYMCNRVMEHCDDVQYVVLEDKDFVDRVLSDKPDFLQTNDYVDNLYESIRGQEGRRTFKAAHYSDVHVDFDYVVGTDAECTMPLCCRLENGYTDDPARQAGEWGSYNCDPPHKTVTSMYEYIRDVIKPDVLFWTGDLTPHNVWENTEEEVIMYQETMAREMQEVFGNQFMVYPLQGNHDVWPVNVQSFSEENAIIKSLTGVWNYWLHEDTIQTFQKAGYYDQYLELNGEVVSNTRVLGVTTQPCNNQNWYLWEVLSDPGDEIAWLESVLQDMEAKGEQAILLGHIPTKGCLRSWGSRFQALMDRYQHIIRFGLFGHAHSEGFFLTRSVLREGFEKSRPIAFNSVMAPSTTYQGKNPSFAVYEIDFETMLVVDINTYYFDIKKANEGNPGWVLYHNILEDYEMEDLSPKSFTKWAERVIEDEEMAVKYQNWSAKDGPDSSHTSCDEHCRQGIYCDVGVSFKDDKDDCWDYLTNGVYSQKEHLSGVETFGAMLGFSTSDMYETMADPWLEEIRK